MGSETVACRPAAKVLILLAVIGAALTATADLVEAQSCNNADPRGVVNERNQRRLSTGGGFCNNNITGSEACGGDVGKIQFELRLAGRQEIDLVCTASDGEICIMANDCQGGVLHERLSSDRVRLRGNVAATALKILVADDTAQTLCNASADITVTCAGSFGGEVLFRSPFEENFDDEGWDLGRCGGCNLFIGSLVAGSSAFSHPEGFEVSRAGEHRGLLYVPDGADFDLVLWTLSGSEWTAVATGEERGGIEEISYQGSPGVYRWEIRAVSGAGVWELRTALPASDGRSDEE